MSHKRQVRRDRECLVELERSEQLYLATRDDKTKRCTAPVRRDPCRNQVAKRL